MDPTASEVLAQRRQPVVRCSKRKDARRIARQSCDGPHEERLIADGDRVSQSEALVSAPLRIDAGGAFITAKTLLPIMRSRALIDHVHMHPDQLRSVLALYTPVIATENPHSTVTGADGQPPPLEVKPHTLMGYEIHPDDTMDPSIMEFRTKDGAKVAEVVHLGVRERKPVEVPKV